MTRKTHNNLASTTLLTLGAIAVALVAGSSAGAAGHRSQAQPLPDIFVMAADGSGQHALTVAKAGDDAPAWSPDGTKIAFSSARDDSYDIYVMQADGSGQTRLTVNRSADDAFPDWSPDGSKIAFESDRDGKYEVYVMNADGSGQTNLTHEPQTDDEGPDWSPDGTKIAFHSEGDIYVMNADGSGQTKVTHGNNVDVFPDWSPDGTKILFVGGGSETGFIDMINPDGSARQRLTRGGSEYFPAWSHDGTKIAYVSAAAGTGDIFVMNADGSGRTNLTRNVRREDFEPSWSPDGTKIAYTSVLDKTPPTLLVAIPSRQRVPRQRGVQVVFLCSEACKYRVTGALEVRGGPKLALKSVAGKLSGFGIKRVKLVLSAARAKKLDAMLAQGKRAAAKVQVRATDPAGNSRTARRRVSVRR